jgi:hypothetical protein
VIATTENKSVSSFNEMCHNLQVGGLIMSDLHV